MTTIHDILNRLDRVHKQGDGWTARCPAHEDKSPSLSVGIGDDGRFLVYCQTGCRTLDVMQAIGLRLCDLFPDSLPLRNSEAAAGSGVRSSKVRATSPPVSPSKAAAARPTPPPQPTIDWEAMLTDIHENAVGVEVATLALQLGVSDISLARLMCGWSYRHTAYAFPMRDGLGEIIGMSLRGRNGDKWAVRGSRLGLFIPNNLSLAGPIFLPEGASDTAALLDIGLNAVGRPSATLMGKRLDHLKTLLATPLCRRRVVVVVADNDRNDAGWRGAHDLAKTLSRVVQTVKILEPLGCKDLREWVSRSVTSETVHMLVANRSCVR